MSSELQLKTKPNNSNFFNLRKIDRKNILNKFNNVFFNKNVIICKNNLNDWCFDNDKQLTYNLLSGQSHMSYFNAFNFYLNFASINTILKIINENDFNPLSYTERSLEVGKIYIIL